MVVDSLLIVTPIVGFCNCSMFCCVLLCIHSSFAIISMGKTELATLLCSSSWCLVFVVLVRKKKSEKSNKYRHFVKKRV